MEIWIGTVGVVLGAIGGAAGTYITQKARMNMEHRLTYDRALRDLRLPHYQQLFHLSGAIPREWRPGEEPKRSELPELRERFHNWYFGPEAGGLFLTEEARQKYFGLMDALVVVSRATGPETLSTEESRRVRSLASDLRHHMAQELGTAERPQLSWATLGPTPAPPPARSEAAVSSP